MGIEIPQMLELADEKLEKLLCISNSFCKKKKSLLEKEEHGEYTGSEAQQRNGKYF